VRVRILDRKFGADVLATVPRALRRSAHRIEWQASASELEASPTQTPTGRNECGWE
jgi:hypothetical protein